MQQQDGSFMHVGIHVSGHVHTCFDVCSNMYTAVQLHMETRGRS